MAQISFATRIEKRGMLALFAAEASLNFPRQMRIKLVVIPHIGHSLSYGTFHSHWGSSLRMAALGRIMGASKTPRTTTDITIQAMKKESLTALPPISEFSSERKVAHCFFEVTFSDPPAKRKRLGRKQVVRLSTASSGCKRFTLPAGSP
jgi:hypothetical protein